MFHTLSTNKKGVSLVEIIVATVVFSVAVVGTFASLSAVHETSNVSERSLQAAYYSRQFLEELRGKIDQDTWDDWTDLNLTCDNRSYAWPDLPNTPFFTSFGGSVNYICQDVPMGARELNLMIGWDEP